MSSPGFIAQLTHAAFRDTKGATKVLRSAKKKNSGRGADDERRPATRPAITFATARCPGCVALNTT